MAKTTDQIKQVVSLGANVSVDGSSKTTDQLKQIASVAVSSGSHVTIRNADSKTTDQLKQIASILKGNVTFEV